MEQSGHRRRAADRAKSNRDGGLRLAALTLALAAAAAAEVVDVEVLSLFRPAELDLTAPVGRRVTGRIGGRPFVLEGERLDLRAVGGTVVAGALQGQALEIAEPSGFRLKVPEKLERAYTGALRIEAEEGRLYAVVRMELEAAVAAVTAAEAGAEAPLAALAAQAVAARSFFVAGGRRHRSASFCDTTHCQHFKEIPDPGSPAAQATAATRGLVLATVDGPLEALSTRSCSGRTRGLAEAGFHQDSGSGYGAFCPPCRRNPMTWERSLLAAEAGEAPPPRASEAARLDFVRRFGWDALPSSAFRVRNGDGRALLEGRGQGHGIGLCQRGAIALAAAGWRWEEILRLYFPNARITRY